MPGSLFSVYVFFLFRVLSLVIRFVMDGQDVVVFLVGLVIAIDCRNYPKLDIRRGFFRIVR